MPALEIGSRWLPLLSSSGPIPLRIKRPFDRAPMWQRSISPEITARLLANDSIARLGRPSETAEAVLWLCSPVASFVNGRAMAVDGGMTVP